MSPMKVTHRPPAPTWETVGLVEDVDGRTLTVQSFNGGYRGGQSKVRLWDGEKVVLEFKAPVAFTLGNLLLAGGRL